MSMLMSNSVERLDLSKAKSLEDIESFKNSAGKYQCNTCDKSYLHFKHLKRHYMKHTGDRPHVCQICQDTFCRSDILKRHHARCLAKFELTGKCSSVSRVPKRIPMATFPHQQQQPLPQIKEIYPPVDVQYQNYQYQLPPSPTYQTYSSYASSPSLPANPNTYYAIPAQSYPLQSLPPMPGQGLGIYSPVMNNSSPNGFGYYAPATHEHYE